ncbi:MAG: YggT family protein [Rhodospirillales bacterium]|nr:YggT family protein [Rhodospirillales bacterium]
MSQTAPRKSSAGRSAARAGLRLRPPGRAASLRPRNGGRRVITILYEILSEILNLYKWAVILAAVFSMLVAFGVLDTRNRMVWTIGDFLYRVTEPALRPIRNFLPNFGGVDLSPLVLIFAVYITQMLLTRIYAAILFGNIQGLFL